MRILLVWVAAMSLSAKASETESVPSTAPLPDLVITASPYGGAAATPTPRPARPQDPGKTTLVLGGEGSPPASRPQDWLDGSGVLPSSVSPTSGEQNTSKGGVVTRGCDPQHTLLLQDGIPLPRDGDGYQDLNSWHLAPGDRLKVLKGAAGVLWGEGALCGVVDVERGTQAGTHAEVKGQVGEPWIQSQTVSLRQRLQERFSVESGFWHSQQDEVFSEPLRASQSPSIGQLGGQVGFGFGKARLLYTLQSQTQELRTGRTWPGVPGVFWTDHKSESRENLFNLRIPLETRSGEHDFQASYTHSHESKSSALENAKQKKERHTITAMAHVSHQWRFPEAGGWTPNALCQLRQESLEESENKWDVVDPSQGLLEQRTLSLPKRTLSSMGCGFMGEIPLLNTVQSPGLRFDNSNLYGATWSWQWGSEVFFSDGWSLEGQIASGWKNPTSRQLWSEFRHTPNGRAILVTGNPDLQPEKSLHSEIRLSKSFGEKTQSAIAIWEQNIQGKIRLDLEDPISATWEGVAYSWKNISQERLRGAEWHTQWQLNETLSLRSHAEIWSSQMKIDDLSPWQMTPDRPKWLGRHSILWGPEDLWAEAHLRHQGAQWTDTTRTHQSPAWEEWGFGGGGTWSPLGLPKCLWSLGAQNLGNTRAHSEDPHDKRPLHGRLYTFALGSRF